MTQRPMSVAIATTSFPRWADDPHGQFVARLASALSERGLDVRVVAPHSAEASEHDIIGGVRIHRFRYLPDGLERVAYGSGVVNNVRNDPIALLGLPSFAAGLRTAVRRAARDADILHAQWAQTAAIAGAPAGTPLVVTLHGTDVTLAHHPVYGRLLSRAVRSASALIAVSDDLAERLEPHLPPGTMPDVIPSGVDRDLVERPRRPHSGEGPPRLVYVGRLLESKGVLDLVEAFTQLGQNVRLTVAGDGPARLAMERFLDSAGLADAVEFLGTVSHETALGLMSEADLVVVPSRSEGCGLVAIEAAALGTPAVVTDTGVMPMVAGCPDAVVKPGDVEGLLKAMRALLDDAEARDRCGAFARAAVSAEFTWDRIAERTVEVYERVLAGGRRS